MLVELRIAVTGIAIADKVRHGVEGTRSSNRFDMNNGQPGRAESTEVDNSAVASERGSPHAEYDARSSYEWSLTLHERDKSTRYMLDRSTDGT